ncbi:hypothetical protein [Pseudooceanicola algae]|uniref:Uncharacterized protein n=1 Tax=Pseudooceanicola algae TaxID=1537215 RepID=A0A418SC81_9RHOB|nr:hypothetical protein [Pseudooceanicola algae]QPM90017.1 hypothetical protein PSAL_012480 [Pseudooceanicola algae]
MRDFDTSPPPEFSSRPWGRVNYDRIGKLLALLHPEERKLMTWLASTVYTGAGEIVDAGAFLGGSAACFAAGLRINRKVTRKDCRIHSYDLFRKGNWLPSQLKEWDARAEGQSTVDLYHDQLGENDFMTVLYAGDITQRSWSDRKIEILMLDCSKTKPLNDHCMRMFYPSLIPGDSYLVHQDYAINSGLYWLHSTMYLLRDYFEHLATVDYGGTTLFRCIKAIPPEMVEEAIARQDEAPEAIRDAAIAWANDLDQPKLARAISYSHDFREE